MGFLLAGMVVAVEESPLKQRAGVTLFQGKDKEREKESKKEMDMEKQEKRRFWIWAAGGVTAAVVMAVAGWLGRSAYQHLKEEHGVARAQMFLDQADYANALLSARQTLQINPGNEAACRIMARVADLSHAPATLDWARRIVEINPASTNKIFLASVGLRYQSFPFPLTVEMLDELSTSATNLAAYQVVAAELALRTRRLADAEKHLAAAWQLDPTNQLYDLNLAVVRLSSTNEATVAAARVALQKFRTDATLGAPALRSLVVDSLAHQELVAAQNYATQLLANAQATLSDRLQYLGILQQQQSADLNAQLKRVQEQSATNAEAVAAVAGWMQANGQPLDVGGWLASLPASIQAATPVRLAWVNVYLASGDWRKLRDYLSQGKWEDMEFMRLAFLSRAWSQLGEGIVAAGNWRLAVHEAGRRYGALLMLLNVAERWGLPSEQQELLEQIRQQFPRERWAGQELVRRYFAAGDTAGLCRLYAAMSAASPDDLILKNNLAATSLLLKTNLPEAYQWAETVHGQKTNDANFAATYAFALQLQGRAEEGLAVMRTLDDRALRQPSAALYYGILLSATGATNEAAPFLAIAEKSGPWLPEEKSLLEAAEKSP